LFYITASKDSIGFAKLGLNPEYARQEIGWENRLLNNDLFFCQAGCKS